MCALPATRLVFALFSSALALSAAPANPGNSPGPAAAATARYDHVHGVLQRVDRKTGEATITHEAIPGYMDAMTMSFAVRPAADADRLRPGDKLVFRLCVTADHAWIEDVRRLETAALPPSSAMPVPTHERDIGETLPDIDLLTQRGEKIRLADFRGRVLALTFIYTRCPLPTYCPLMNRNFQSAQALLDRMAPEANGQFLSISLDPDHDSPAVLTAYAKNYGANPLRWTFASADDGALRSLGDGVGLEFSRGPGPIAHNLRTVVIDASGRIRRIFRGNAWTPQELAAALRAAQRPPS